LDFPVPMLKKNRITGNPFLNRAGKREILGAVEK
jgi:hypothetical protein